MSHMSPFIAIAFACLLAVPAIAQQATREQAADAYKWNLTDLYPTDDAWRSAKTQLASEKVKRGYARR